MVAPSDEQLDQKDPTVTVFTAHETELFAGLSAELRRIAAELSTGQTPKPAAGCHLAQRLEGYARAIDEDLGRAALPFRRR